MKTAAFIGTGNMGSALARATCRAIGPGEVVLSNRTAAKAEALAGELGCAAAADNAQAVEGARYVFLCVKPQMMEGVLSGLGPVLRRCHEAGEDKVLVSVAAGLRLADLSRFAQGAGYVPAILRLMPNTCVGVGQGVTALCAPEGADGDVLAEVEGILSASGLVTRIPEGQMDAFSALAGCGPAFACLFLEALADGGVMAGLPRKQALEYAARMVQGTCAMALASGKHPGALKDEVCSPAGSTIAGVAALERGGFRAAAMEAVLASWRRNAELGG